MTDSPLFRTRRFASETASSAPEKASPDTVSLPEAELRMRQALGLRPRDPGVGGRAGSEADSRAPADPFRDRAVPKRHKHRFVQDGEVPVVLVNSETGPAGASAHARGVDASAPRNRLAMAETALDNERSARERVERSLQEAMATIRDLQTKLGHAELAHREALEKAKADVRSFDPLREELEGLKAALASEREARDAANRELQKAVAARDIAEQRARNAMASQPAARTAKALPGKPAPARGTRKPAAAPKPAKKAPASKPARRTPEPKPVKWWIQPASKKTRSGG